MCSKVATVKQTSGAGYKYEDKAGVYFLLCMLLGRHPFHHQIGIINRVDFQTGADGWGFDDLLITLENAKGLQKVGVSVKSSQQFSGEIILANLLHVLWEQQLQIGNKTFDHENNYCCLTQPPFLGKIGGNLNTLINLARSQDAQDLNSRVKTKGYISADKLKLYRSFGCPTEFKPEAKKSNFEIGNILSKFIVLEFDFELNVSKSINELISLSGSALADSNTKESIRFYEKLLQLCGEIKTAGGYYDLPKLIAVLRHDFRLKNAPAIEADLQVINDNNHQTLSTVKVTIGTSFKIDRSKEISQIKDAFVTHSLACISAPSGFGKTTLAKLYSEEMTDNCFLIWLNSTHFEQLPERSLKLSHKLSKIAQLQSRKKVLIIIDGLERFYRDQQVQHLTSFLNEVFPTIDGLQILFTCISEDFNEAILKLNQFNFFDPNLITVQLFNSSLDLLNFVVNFPTLVDILRNPAFRTLMNNIKLLDALTLSLTAINIKEFNGLQVTESEIIDFLWKKQVESGKQGMLDAKVVKTIAEVQANTLQMGVSNSTIDSSSAAALSNIVAKGLIYEREDYFFFQHELFGDWARYKVVRSHSQDLQLYLSDLDISSPLWSKAIRQYGIHLLETKNKEQFWLKLIQQLDDSPKQKVLKSIFLESVIFSTNTKETLTEISTQLLENGGYLLNNLLRVFLLKATKINPEVLKIAKQLKGIAIAEAAGINRLPNVEYWLPLLEFIYLHKTAIVQFDFQQAAQIACDWLAYTPKASLWRKEMAEMAFDLASIVQNSRRYSYRNNKDSKQRTIKGLFYGYNEIPEKASALLLSFAQRTPREAKKETERIDRPTCKSHRFRTAEKWPLGPYESIDEDFREVCLNHRVLDGVFIENPMLANEILLAVLIKEPEDDYYQNGISNDLELDVPHNWSPPFYRRGPFLNLLYLDPLPALAGIVDLVEFATQQWLSQYKDEKEEIFLTLNIGGNPKKFFGNVSVYLWYRNIGVPPESLVSALMAIERYLYEIRDQKALLETCIDYLLENSTSLAVIGLLTSIGKAIPSLFKDKLLPIIEMIEFYRWEQSNLVSFHLDQYGLNNLPFLQRTEADSWNKELHRVRPLGDLMIWQLLNSEDFKKIYKSITAKWEKELAPQRHKKGFDIYYDRLLSFFDPANYALSQVEDGNQYFDYVEPEALKIRMTPYRTSYNDRQIRPNAFTIYDSLDKNKEFTLTDLEKLWEQVEALKKRKVTDWFNHLETPLSSILGSYIIFLKFREIWIKEHPDYEAVIFEYTGQTFEQMRREKVKVRSNSVQWHWNNFAPQLVAYCWQLRDTEDIRTWITLICLNLHEESVMHLFAYTSRLKKWNAQEFIELQNYILRLATLNEYVQPEEIPNIEDKRDILSKLFISKGIPAIPENWSQYRSQTFKNKPKWDRQVAGSNDQQLLEPGLQLSLLKVAFEKLPYKNLPEDNAELQHIIFLWKEAFDQVIYQFGDINAMSQSNKDYPLNFDGWVIRSIPGLLNENTGVDFMKVFAEPLLKFGYFLPEYVKMYSASILSNHLDYPESYDKLIPAWKNIFLFCLSHENWQYKRNGNKKFLHLSLFLLNPEQMKFWDLDFSTFITAAQNQFADFFNEYYMNPSVTLALCNFAKTISGRQFLTQAIKLLHTAVQFYLTVSRRPVPDGKILQSFHANEQLAKLLSYSWENQKELIEINLETFQNYKELVLYLVSIKHVVGIELQAALIK